MNTDDPAAGGITTDAAGVSAPGTVARRFTPHPERPRLLLIGEGVGIAPVIGFAEAIRDRHDADWHLLVLLGSGEPFPFRPRPSLIVVPGVPDGCIACMPLLDSWSIASRLASPAGFPGCFEGSVTELAHEWLQTLSPDAVGEIELLASGPPSLLQATAHLAQRFGVPHQPSTPA